MDRLESHRSFFTNLITAGLPKNKARLQSAFAATNRERFLGPGPWKVFVVPSGYIDGRKLGTAFLRGDARNVRSLRRRSTPDGTAWFAARPGGSRRSEGLAGSLRSFRNLSNAL
jgi:hypothetical protein